MNNDIIERALATLNVGGTLLYPTDTIWGIGCDAVNPSAIERVYAIKERDHSKSMLILASAEMLSPEVPSEVRQLLLESERPTTVVLPARYVTPTLPQNLLAADGTVGVRVPRMDFCQTLLRLFGRPIVSTSANFSGRPSPQCCRRQSRKCCPAEVRRRRNPGWSFRIRRRNAQQYIHVGQLNGTYPHQSYH